MEQDANSIRMLCIIPAHGDEIGIDLDLLAAVGSADDAGFENGELVPAICCLIATGYH